ncbi:MAG: M48 family metallopeptidase [Alphaproteobacteria bacterium]|nr:M48 family metallopeptidase [Alphaproteobacteria bacterium]
MWWVILIGAHDVVGVSGCFPSAVPSQPSRTLRLGNTEIPYELIRTKQRRRTIAFAIEGREGLVVRAPMKASFKSIEELAQKFSRWIMGRLAELQDVAPPRPMVGGATVPVLGQELRLRVLTGSGRRPTCARIGDALEIRIPPHVPSDDYSRAIRDTVMDWYCAFAEEDFTRRADAWAACMGVAYASIAVSNPRARWGSCSAGNDIRINWRLAMAPPALLDYVIAHELCHVVHKNHSRRFWSRLAKVMPDWRERRDELRRIGPGLSLEGI